MVVITEDDNVNELISTNFNEFTDKILFTIDIYAEDKAMDNTTISNVNIARELASLVDDIMIRKYRMQRIFCKPTPNLDDSIYRLTIKYTKKVISNKNILI